MAEQYAREVARLAVLGIVDAAGFDVAHQSCVEILSDVLLSFITQAGAASHHYAELAGRNETNAVDVVRGGDSRSHRSCQIQHAPCSVPSAAAWRPVLSHLSQAAAHLADSGAERHGNQRGAAAGLCAACAGAHGCVLGSAASPSRTHAPGGPPRRARRPSSEPARPLPMRQEVPFEVAISAFPLRKKARPPPTFLDRGEAPPPHIPPWLPALPDRHTYQATPVYPGGLAARQAWRCRGLLFAAHLVSLGCTSACPATLLWCGTCGAAPAPSRVTHLWGAGLRPLLVAACWATLCPLWSHTGQAPVPRWAPLQGTSRTHRSGRCS